MLPPGLLVPPIGPPPLLRAMPPGPPPLRSFGIIVTEVYDSIKFDLVLEHAFAREDTHTCGTSMTVKTTRSRAQMKRHLLQLTAKDLDVYVDQNALFLKAPRRNRRKTRAAQPLVAQTPRGGRRATQNIAERVDVVLTPASQVKARQPPPRRSFWIGAILKEPTNPH